MCGSQSYTAHRTLPTTAAEQEELRDFLKQIAIDTRSQVKLTFDTKEEAIAYCEREGLAYQVLPVAPAAKVIKKSYSDNFKFGRSVNWTH